MLIPVWWSHHLLRVVVVGVFFKDVERNKYPKSDQVATTAVWGVHYNTCDPSNVHQFVLERTRSGYYKKCADQSLKEVMVQMDTEPFVSVRAVRELLSKAMPNRKHQDSY